VILEGYEYFNGIGDRNPGSPYLRCLVRARSENPDGQRLLSRYRRGNVRTFWASYREMNNELELVTFNCVDGELLGKKPAGRRTPRRR
jgi:hypothetical protein